MSKSTLLRVAMQLILLTLTFNIIAGHVSAQQGCPGITFESQSQVDSFPVNYPGCNRILGTLSFYSDDILFLDSLYNINVIEGDLEIWGYNNFQGLHNLDSIYGNLYLGPDYGDVYNMENLQYVGGDLDFTWTDATSMPGFPNLTTINGNVEIYANQFLEDITGLSNLTTINEGLHIESNFQLTSLAGLENVISDSLDNLMIRGNETLSVCSLPFMCEILSNPSIPINIYNNAPECNNPAVIANTCGVTLTCLPYGNYYVTTQAEAENFGSLYPGCSNINGNLTIVGDAITSLPGLIGITSINGSFDVGPTQNLINFSGLDSLKTIDGRFQVGWWEGSYNNALVNFVGLGSLTSVGRVEVINNQSLQNFEGLENLRTMGNVEIIYNDNLTSFQGLSNLDTIKGSLDVGGNAQLSDLSALINLKRIEGRLDFRYNDMLVSMHGLDSAKMDHISIRMNPQLSECDIKSICYFLAVPGSWATFEQNTTGCNTREEVEAECQVGINDISGYKNLLIYPNPVTDFFMVNLSESPVKIQLTVYNSSGQALITKQITPMDQWVNVSTLSKGVYIVKIASGNIISFGKFVK